VKDSSERTPGARNAPRPTIGIAAIPSLAIELSLACSSTTDMALRARGGGLTLLGPCPALQFLLETFGPAVGIEFVASA